jgi:hypothetical protein
MPTLDGVYRKFGEASEASQLLETELGNILFLVSAADGGLFERPDRQLASDLIDKINRHTLGQLLRSLNAKTQSLDTLEPPLWHALEERNLLSHTFYRQHNFRRNSDEGRALMMEDLESIHNTLLDAYKAVMLLSGVDLDAAVAPKMPTRHLPI